MVKEAMSVTSLNHRLGTAGPLFTVTCLILLGQLRSGIQVFRHRGSLLNGATDYLQLHLSRSGASSPPLKVGMLVASLTNKMQWR